MPKLMTTDSNGNTKKSFTTNTLDRAGQTQRLDENPIHYVEIDSIVVDPEFQNIFPIQESVLAALIDNMSEQGFNANYPLLIWSQNSTLLDGHTRLKAAKKTNIDFVPVVFLTLKNKEEALQIIYKVQFNRRNVIASDILHFLDNYMKTLDEKPPYLRQQLSKILNTSEITVHKYLYMLQNKESALFASLMQDKISISRAYALLKAAEKTDMPVKPENPDIISSQQYIQEFQAKVFTLSDQDKQIVLPILNEALTILNLYPKQINTILPKLILTLMNNTLSTTS